VFILYAIPIGILVGFLAGGTLDRLAEVRFRWAALALAGLAVQVLIFGPLDRAVGEAGPYLYVGSTVAVLVAVLRNVRIPGLALVAAGAGTNLAAILANGGVMPADPGALATAGLEVGPGFSNSDVLANPALRPLTDIFALPAGVPFANVFSVGDVLIAVGVATAIAVSMRPRGPVAAPPDRYH
jgi:Family of unknown function (DUF5317)